MKKKKLKQILLHKCWRLIFIYFGAAKCGRSSNIACPLGAKSGRAARPPCPIDSAVNELVMGNSQAH